MTVFDEFVSYLRNIKGLSKRTIYSYCLNVNKLSNHLICCGISFETVTTEDIKQYLSTKKDHEQYNATTAFNNFFTFLLVTEKISINPMSGLRYKKPELPLKPDVTPDRIKTLVNSPNSKTFLGKRDRLIMAFMYATGVRVGELVAIKLCDINKNSASVLITGKGDKQRILPLPAFLIEEIDSYLDMRNSEITYKFHSDYLFCPRQPKNKPLSISTIWYRVKIYANRVGLHSGFSCHSLRHAFASHLIQNGANIRVLQLLLGHESIDSTQIYAELYNDHLLKLHQEHHPRA